VLPAPAAVPVDRFVGIGFVGPWTVRPVRGVCASSSSRPVPPSRLAGGFVFVLVFVRGLAAARRAARGFACFRRILAFDVFAPAVLRPVFRRTLLARFRPAPLRAEARAPEPARLLGGVRFWTRRFTAFLAMVSTS